MQEIQLAKLQLLKQLTREQRVQATRLNFAYFFCYYLPHYVSYPFAPFHYQMMDDLHDLLEGQVKELAWIAFRESAKTSLAKGFLLYLLCFQKDQYINVDSYDKENAERILFDVVWELQTNQRIKQDFGQIYNIQRTPDQVTQKRIANFVTNPAPHQLGIRVEAHSTQEPVRGRLHGASRPGLIILDDFENRKTIKSEEYTKNIREHMQEFKGGIDSTRGRVLYLGNYLSEFANVQSLIERARVDPGLRVRIIPIEAAGQPTWPEKYVTTDQAVTGDKISIEGLRRRMWTPENGDDDFLAEMLCQPVDYANSDFKREWFEQNRYYDSELENKVLYHFMAIDNAPSQNEESDYIGCVVMGVDENDIWYFRWVKRYKLNAPEMIEEMYRLNSVFQCKTVGFEQKGYQNLYRPYLLKRGQELKQVMYTVELKDKGRHKEDRIRGALQGRFANGRIKLKRYATDDTSHLIKELAQFPHSKFDDLCDAAAYLSDIAYAPAKAAPSQPVTPRDFILQDRLSAYERSQQSDIPDTI